MPILFYTPTKYVSAGEEVFVENLSTFAFNQLLIDADGGNFLTLDSDTESIDTSYADPSSVDPTGSYYGPLTATFISTGGAVDKKYFTYEGISLFGPPPAPPTGGAGGVIDSYSESNQNAVAQIGSDTLPGGIAGGFGQCFTGDGTQIVDAKWYLRRHSGPTGNAVAKIWTMTGTFGVNGNVGTLLATSDPVNVSTLPTGFALVTFSFTGANQYITTNGTFYVVTVEYTTGDGSNFVELGYDSTGTHPATWCYHALGSSGAWTAIDSGIDLCFYVDGVAVSTGAGADATSLGTLSGAPNIVLQDPITFTVTTTGTSVLTAFNVMYTGAIDSTITLKVTGWPPEPPPTGPMVLTGFNEQEFVEFIEVVNFETYDPGIFRIYLITPLELPWGCPKLPPNEWVVADNINDVFAKFKLNLDYLENAAHMYDAPPTNYLGWYGTRVASPPVWHAHVEGLSADYLMLSGAIPYGTDFTNVKDIKVRDDYLCLVQDTKIVVRFPNQGATIAAQVTKKSTFDTFGSIAAIDFDSNNTMFVADSQYNEISLFSFQSRDAKHLESPVITYLFKWGGVDSYLPKTRFVTLNDIHIDADDNVFVVDVGNSCVKKFSQTGAWLFTIRHFTIAGTTVSNGGPISVTTDQNGNIHVLSIRGISMFTKTGTFIRRYWLPDAKVAKGIESIIPLFLTLAPKKVLTNYNKNGFIYVVYSQMVLKFTQDGSFAGVVTENIEPFLPKEFNSATQDKNYNLYIAANPAIYKYADLVTIVNVKTDTSALEWPLSSIQIKSDEFIQDWVYNRSFARLWDNMEIFRRSIYDKFIDQEVQPGVSALHTGFFTVSDELYFPYSKDDIIIGMNEFVTFNVLNRVIEKLCANLEILRLMLLERPFIPPHLQGMFYWCWKAVRCRGVNPIIWYDTDPNYNGWKITKWREAISNPCCPGQHPHGGHAPIQGGPGAPQQFGLEPPPPTLT